MTDPKPILDRAAGGERISPEEALVLLGGAPLLELGWAADLVRHRLHPGGTVTYIVDRNINYTNACTSECRFCAFYRKPGSPGTYVLSEGELLDKVRETVEMGGTGILLQGGHNPELPFEYYEGLLRCVRDAYPEVHLHCFSPPEIVFFSQRFGMSVAEVITRLREVGLRSIPGGGAEVLSEGVRAVMAPGKATVDQWLSAMREAHRQGMKTTATMMFGSVEGPVDLVEHLRNIRDLQDETGGFTAFIPWTFQPGENTPLRTCTATGVDYLRTVALSRLFLDNVPNLQASWVTQGLQLGQVALHFGANDMGSVMIEENVVAAAGCRNRTNEGELRRVIAEAGFRPRKRRTLYEPAE